MVKGYLWIAWKKWRPNGLFKSIFDKKWFGTICLMTLNS